MNKRLPAAKYEWEDTTQSGTEGMVCQNEIGQRGAVFRIGAHWQAYITEPASVYQFINTFNIRADAQYAVEEKLTTLALQGVANVLQRQEPDE